MSTMNAIEQVNQVAMCHAKRVAVLALILATGLSTQALHAAKGEYPPSNYALRFIGQEGEYLELGNLGEAVFDGEFTFETWLLAESHPESPNRRILELKADQADDEWLLRLWQARRGWANNITLDIHTGAYSSGSKGPFTAIIALGEWHHLAVSVKAGKDVTFYVNGEDVTDSRQAPGSFTLSDLSSARVGELFHGQFTDIRVWNTYRTQSEVRGNMNRSFSKPPKGLVGAWPMNEGGTDIV